ncbi:hypothetical protein [Chitinophaga sp. S165]|uniref:hypothetical protein n=1 Tax=Chitinophaga sp. S165 TaxID=2135462 RepID=UPI000D70B082|nr:hypothetical protein [Chitinophaga sp. S165]PWV57028.1 hypothetical protein C7475_1011548 [Chitinophaga sp. S165]
MKRTLIALLAAAMFIVNAGFTTKDGDPPVKKESTSAACGPRFVAYNDHNLPVLTIELKNFYTGYSTTVYNPTFPYDFGEREAGVYVFNVTYAEPLEGSIGIYPENPGVGVMWCSGPKWEATWSMSWPSHICTTDRIQIGPDISCRN